MEYRKIVAVLCRQFGLNHIDAAEDIAGETFLAALETWPFKGIPPNPVAWLYTVAKNKTKNFLSAKRHEYEKIKMEGKTTPAEFFPDEPDLSPQHISDSQLRMLFAVSHPSLSTEAQVALALRILCGFGIDEMAHAFLTGKDTIEKRLYRAKEKLRSLDLPLDVPQADELAPALRSVLTTIYLLFNEGYYSETDNRLIREDLCMEAMSLAHLLLGNRETETPEVNALLALMCFQASRFPARKNKSGEIILYEEQDESLWNQELIEKGIYFLHRSSAGNQLSKYHLEAAIAFHHTKKENSREKWETVLQLYNRLLLMEYSPVAALNRTYVFSRVFGNKMAIEEAEKLKLTGNPYYFLLLGTLYQGMDDEKSALHFLEALGMVKTETEKQVINSKLAALNKNK